MQDTQEAGIGLASDIESKDFPSRAEVLVDVRRMIEAAAGQTKLDREPIDDLLTAVDEAAANAIRHGVSGKGANEIFRIRCLIESSYLEVQVRDFGRGFAVPELPVMPTPDAMGGRGLPLMIALTDSVAIESTPHGTTVTLIKRFEP